MSHSERVVRAFCHLRKSADSAFAAVCAESFATAGEYLVRIGLVPDVKYEFVGRGVIDIVETDYKFDGTKTRGYVPRIAGTAVEHIAADFCAQLRQGFLREFAEVLRTVNFVEIA